MKYCIGSEHKICFGASLSQTNRFGAWRKKPKEVWSLARRRPPPPVSQFWTRDRLHRETMDFLGRGTDLCCCRQNQKHFIWKETLNITVMPGCTAEPSWGGGHGGRHQADDGGQLLDDRCMGSGWAAGRPGQTPHLLPAVGPVCWPSCSRGQQLWLVVI